MGKKYRPHSGLIGRWGGGGPHSVLIGMGGGGQTSTLPVAREGEGHSDIYEIHSPTTVRNVVHSLNLNENSFFRFYHGSLETSWPMRWPLQWTVQRSSSPVVAPE